LTDVSQISLGDVHTCALKTNGTVYCWGHNVEGQLGDNTNENKKTPVQVQGINGEGYLLNIVQIGLGGGGWGHTCALKTDGTVYCWGANNFGQLGDNTTTNRHTPVPVMMGEE